MIISRTCKYCNSQFEKNVSKRTRLTNIPGKDINMKSVIAIPNTNYGLNKWLSYEKPIDKIVMCCNEGGFDES